MKKKDLVKQKFLTFIILGIIILLSACTLVGPQKKSPSGSTNVSRKIGFEERKAEDLLKNSISIPYPDGKFLHLPHCQMMGLLMARLLTKDMKIRIILPV